MTYRTVLPADWDSYLASEYPASLRDAAKFRAVDIADRQLRLAAFPHSVLLQLSYPELDYANRWCWQQFGPAHGDCLEQAGSEYPACDLPIAHSHEGKWLTYWLAKTEYNFGFNEWCFARQEDRDRFLEFVPQINWGERYPK
jgi:hypothetical protein